MISRAQAEQTLRDALSLVAALEPHYQVDPTSDDAKDLSEAFLFAKKLAASAARLWLGVEKP
jgi:hypothetical protein